MRTLSEICVLVKKEYEEGHPLHYKNENHLGLCSAIIKLRDKSIISSFDYNVFMKEYKFSIKRQEYFYSSDNSVSLLNFAFKWPPKNREARIKWLDKRIKDHNKSVS